MFLAIFDLILGNNGENASDSPVHSCLFKKTAPYNLLTGDVTNVNILMFHCFMAKKYMLEGILILKLCK